MRGGIETGLTLIENFGERLHIIIIVHVVRCEFVPLIYNVFTFILFAWNVDRYLKPGEFCVGQV